MTDRVRAGWLSVSLAVVLATPACSYLFVTPPHARVERGDENCTTSQLSPAVDSLFVGSNVVTTIYRATSDVKNKAEVIGIGAWLAAFWLSSAIYGFYNTNRCRELIEEDAEGPYARGVPLRQRPSLRPMEPLIRPRIRPAPETDEEPAPIEPPPPQQIRPE